MRRWGQSRIDGMGQSCLPRRMAGGGLVGFLGLCLSARSSCGEVGLGQVELDLMMMKIYNDVDDG